MEFSLYGGLMTRVSLIGRERGEKYMIIMGQVKRMAHLVPFRFRKLTMTFQVTGLFLLLI
jgi:hypothetical protein